MLLFYWLYWASFLLVTAATVDDLIKKRDDAGKAFDHMIEMYVWGPNHVTLDDVNRASLALSQADDRLAKHRQMELTVDDMYQKRMDIILLQNLEHELTSLMNDLNLAIQCIIAERQEVISRVASGILDGSYSLDGQNRIALVDPGVRDVLERRANQR